MVSTASVSPRLPNHLTAPLSPTPTPPGAGRKQSGPPGCTQSRLEPARSKAPERRARTRCLGRPARSALEPSAGASGLASVRMITLIMEAARRLQHILWHVNCRKRTLSAVSFLTKEKQYMKRVGGGGGLHLKPHPSRLYPKHLGRSLHLFFPPDSLWQEDAPRRALLLALSDIGV